MVIRSMIVMFCLYAVADSAVGQQMIDSIGTEESFRVAREKIFANRREEGQAMLREILQRSPQNHDARILLARTYAWNDEFDLATRELEVVLKEQPGLEEALDAIVDVQIWNGRDDLALAYLNSALKFNSANSDFLYKKAQVLHDLGRNEEALEILVELIRLRPDHLQAISLSKIIREQQMKYVASIGYGVDFFSRTFGPAQYASAQLSRSSKWGSSAMRINYASRFSSNGLQTEFDLYPKITKGIYAYLNYGYSNSTLFTKHRIGSELYFKLPHAIEFSGGIRYLSFASGTRISIYTGSLGWYFGNFWISYRPYITPDKTGTSFASALLLRKYFSDAETYLGLNGQFGFSPDERRIQTGSGLSDHIYVLKSQNIGITYQKKFPTHFILNLSYLLTHQELSFDLGQYAWINGFQIAVKRKF